MIASNKDYISALKHDLKRAMYDGDNLVPVAIKDNAINQLVDYIYALDQKMELLTELIQQNGVAAQTLSTRMDINGLRKE